jgi:hypothetical protein
MKLLVDIEKLQAQGTVTAEQAAAIRRAASAETMSFAVNVILALGVIAVVAGVIALRPGAGAMALVGGCIALGGLLLRLLRTESFGFLGGALLLVGALLHGVAALIAFKGGMAAFAYVAALYLILGAAARHGLLIALSVFALAGFLGSSTGYWHASYGLWVKEPSFTIAAFGLLAIVALAAAPKLGAAYRRLAQIFALLCVVWMNFGFWVGSLRGDHPGSSWARSELLYSDTYIADRYQRLQDWYAQALRIPADAFAVAWAAALLGLGAWAAAKNRRGLVNAAATFASIHFFTQWFERLKTAPETVIAAGAIAVAIAFALWRYNQRMQAGA